MVVHLGVCVAVSKNRGLKCKSKQVPTLTCDDSLHLFQCFHFRALLDGCADTDSLHVSDRQETALKLIGALKR